MTASIAGTLHVGDGWRIGVDPERYPYSALIGGDDWAVELTKAEWHDFSRGLGQLQAAMVAASETLVEDELLTVEHQTELITAIATGRPDSFSVFIQLTSARCCEGSWGCKAVPELLDVVAVYAV